jgi:hypothetical protein
LGIKWFLIGQGKLYKFNLGIKKLIVGQGFNVWIKY